jgi:hypothetical protein
MKSLLRQPFAFAFAVMAVYALLLFPAARRAGFDPSLFILAGDAFVASDVAAPPIIVRPNAPGYDGEFYYRLAQAPFNANRTVFGIQFDRTEWRMRRILYPLLVRAVAFGVPQLVPTAMLLVNLLGLGAIALYAVRFTALLRLGPWFPLAIALWPGFIITLTHDTTEITAAALLIAAFYHYYRKQFWLYALLGALATMTRETSILALGGVLVFEGFRALRAGLANVPPGRLLPCVLAPLPYLIWRAGLALALGPPSAAEQADHDVGWPLKGVADMFWQHITGARAYAPTPLKDLVMRVYDVGSGALLVAFCVTIAMRLPAILRDPAKAAFGAAWIPIIGLMSLLSADGPWIEPAGYFRAFTECYLVGMLILALVPPSKLQARVLLAGGGLSMVGAWLIALIQSRA